MSATKQGSPAPLQFLSYVSYLFAAGLAMASSPAGALTGSNYVGILIGERPMGMGGAYVAVADDPSGLYYNPAGIVYSHAPNLSASVNAYHITNSRYEDALGKGSDYERKSQEFLPNFFGTTQPLGPVTVGFSYATPVAVREQQSQTFPAGKVANEDVQRYSVNVDNSDTVNEIGPSIAMEVNERLAIGSTLYLHQRKQKTIMTQVIDLQADVNGNNVDDYEVQTRYSNDEQLGVGWMLGALFAATERISIGASIRGTEIVTATNSRKGVCRGSEVQEYDEVPCIGSNQYIEAGEIVFVDKIETNYRDSYPLETRIGLAWFASQRLLLAADMIHFTSAGARRAVTNFALGGEYYITPDWAVRAGAYTDYANTHPQANHHVDRYGGTFSLTRFTRNSSVSVGVNGAYGVGDARIVAADDAGYSQELITSSFTLFLATSYAY